MSQVSTSLLLNLAILKVNWDKNRDVIHNFMPLVGYAITTLPTDVVSVTELKEAIQTAANFRIPTGALESLVRRASRPPYRYVERKAQNFHRILQNIPSANFIEERERVQASFERLFNEFNAFCAETFAEHSEGDASRAFFEVLYDIAPHIADAAAELSIPAEDANQAISNLRYRAARFIEHERPQNSESAAAIENFIRGAVLAESFYYSSPENVRSKFRDVAVFYDTRLLSQILGYASAPEVEKAQELHAMVRASHARTRIFEHNLQELIGIFNAALAARKSGPLRPRKPGDIFDFFNANVSTVSDIQLELGRLDQRLTSLGISVVEHPPYSIQLGVDETKLAHYIRDEVYYVSDWALQADIASLSAIYRLRGGRSKQYLEACDAIFVTTNSALARASTIFFNDEHGHSDAPVCISDHVFCMLVWLKVADKWPDAPTDLMVATCYAALQPSTRLWDNYIAEAEKLKARGDIVAADFALLAHSIEARQALMDITEGDEEAFVVGSAAEVLAAAKAAVLRDSEKALEAKDAEIAQTARASARERNAQAAEIARGSARLIEGRERLGKILYTLFAAILLLLILWASVTASSANVLNYFSGHFDLNAMLTRRTGEVALWCILWVLGGFNLVLGWAFVAPARRAALWLAGKIVA